LLAKIQTIQCLLSKHTNIISFLLMKE